MQKAFLTIGILFISYFVSAQNNKNVWQIGMGMAAVKFAKSDVSYIGDQYLFQIPRFNLTVPINERLSADAALSFNTIKDIFLISNSIRYFSVDASVRYNFNELSMQSGFFPFAFVGGSIVGSERKMSPTINFGGGITYWFKENWGVSSQLYYKYSLESYESMRSHIQGTLGIVYNLDFGRSNLPCDH
ncbi:hypothetical protein [Tenacibaculum sp. UWU-22]|uniref:hypothetical protein n=1 Tax=Tenacibaculum sp. UWU-22 TaxID=3234187 RepID=UPI0034DB6CC4